jgi:hypothetical protein
MTKSIKCTSCDRRIQATNNKRIPCCLCKRYRHLKCTPFIAITNDTICPVCITELFPFCNIESDTDFFLALSSNKDYSPINHQLLNDIRIEFKCDFASTLLTDDDDLDADTNYYNTLFNSTVNYYETTNLNPLTPRPIKNIPQFLLHLNARSLSKNIDSITTELSLLTNKPSIIAVSETWAANDSDSFPIPGYSFIHKARTTKIGGGVGLYLQDHLDLKYKIRPDLHIDDISDSLFIQITSTKLKNIIIGSVYKPPDVDVLKFCENLDRTLRILTKERRPCYILGDFNINLLKQNLHSPTKHFLDTILSHGFFPLINKPTRITTESVTLIDNILTNVHDLQTKSGIWMVDISDHLPVFSILPNRSMNFEIKKKLSKRMITPEKMNKFKFDLQNYDWTDIENLQDVNLMYASFVNTVQKLYEKSFPIQTVTIKPCELFKPWITTAIKNQLIKNIHYIENIKSFERMNHSLLIKLIEIS